MRYAYDADVLRVVDGDTVRLRIDVGLDVRVNLSCRLDGINAPEKSTTKGKEVADWLAYELGATVFVHTVKDRREKYGRYLVRIWPDRAAAERGDPTVNERMLVDGRATAYEG